MIRRIRRWNDKPCDIFLITGVVVTDTLSGFVIVYLDCIMAVVDCLDLLNVFRLYLMEHLVLPYHKTTVSMTDKEHIGSELADLFPDLHYPGKPGAPTGILNIFYPARDQRAPVR